MLSPALSAGKQDERGAGLVRVPHNRNAANLTSELHTVVGALCRGRDSALLEGEITQA